MAGGNVEAVKCLINSLCYLNYVAQDYVAEEIEYLHTGSATYMYSAELAMTSFVHAIFFDFDQA